MIHYKFYLKNPQSHYIYVDITIDEITTPILELQLPAWRPGRYELGNFAKNVKRVDVYDEYNNSLSYTKATKDLWIVTTNNSKKITVTYSYYTSEINAGNCYADDTQLYVNPVHLCMFVPNRVNEKHVVELDIPDTYKVATSLQKENKRLIANSFDELADSPIMASENIQSDFYDIQGVKLWLHFLGECKPDFEKFKTDFIKFTATQFNFWQGCPVDEYHFLFQILPFRNYHGVEHQKSTVIAIGPGYSVNKGKTYDDILGVSSHELFHTWNIKYIRPTEMLPYDFTKENYARTGYVYEGFTTYYGDLLLLSSGVFNIEQYFETLEERLQKHFHNYGRFNLSVSNSSWETWLDGYVIGTPYRKTSIYDEGNLVAFMLDVLIMKQTQNKKGLRDVCRILYTDFGKKQKGYSEQDVMTICETIAGISLTDFFSKYVYGTHDFEPLLQECFNYLEIDFIKTPNANISEALYGFKTTDFGHNKKVTLTAPSSPCYDAELSIGDEIIAVNGFTLKGDFNEWMNYFKDNDIELTLSSNQQLKKIRLTKHKNGITYFDTIKLKLKHTESVNFKSWIALNS